MKLRIVSDGTPRGTYVFDGDGQVVRRVQRIEWIADIHEPHATVKLTLVGAVELDGDLLEAEVRTAITTVGRQKMDNTEMTAAVRKQLRVREPLAARELAARAGLKTNQISTVLHDLVHAGHAVRHPGSTRRGDRSARYTAPSKAKA